MVERNPVLTQIMMAQIKQETLDAKKELKQVQKDHQRTQKEHDKVKKQKESLEKEHKDAKKELHSLKLQYDAKYAFEWKQEKKQTMERVRSAKQNKNKMLRTYGKTAKNSPKN